MTALIPQCYRQGENVLVFFDKRSWPRASGSRLASVFTPKHQDQLYPSISLVCCEILQNNTLQWLSCLQRSAFCIMLMVLWVGLGSTIFCFGFTRLSRTRLGSRIQVGFRSVSHLFIPRLWLKEQQPPGHILLWETMETERDWQNSPCLLTPDTGQQGPPPPRSANKVSRMGCMPHLHQTKCHVTWGHLANVTCIVLSQERSRTGSNYSDFQAIK